MTTIPPSLPVGRPAHQHSPLFQAAQKLETAFIAEMLRSSGIGREQGSLSGGAGAEHFSTFLISAQAERLADAGGIGLAESLFRAMNKTNGGQGDA